MDEFYELLNDSLEQIIKRTVKQMIEDGEIYYDEEEKLIVYKYDF